MAVSFQTLLLTGAACFVGRHPALTLLSLATRLRVSPAATTSPAVTPRRIRICPASRWLPGLFK